MKKQIEIAKITNDFLFINEPRAEEKAQEVYNFSHSLTPHGFERYIQYYFEKFHNYKLKMPTDTYEPDDGIDLIGFNKDGVILVQCKKYETRNITSTHVRDFAGSIFATGLQKDGVKMYFVTTSKLTLRAKEFAKKADIIHIDFEQIYKAIQVYSLEAFIEEISSKEDERCVKRCLQSKKIPLPSFKNKQDDLQCSDSEILYLLRNVRQDLSEYKQMRLTDIASNETLRSFSMTRPHNTRELGYFIQGLNQKEAKKMQEYGNIFLDRCKIIRKSY